MKVMITGHRPAKLGGYNPGNPKRQQIGAKFNEIFDRAIIAANKKNQTVVAISGMALGCDQWWANQAIDEGLEVHAYVPFEGQENRWPQSAQQYYNALLNKCKRIVISCSGMYAPWKMQKRNRDMVDNADFCIAVWDGTNGGTGNCVSYIIQKRKPLLIVDPKTMEEHWYKYESVSEQLHLAAC